MQNVTIICVGKLKEQYLKDALSEYSKRLSAYCKFNILELNEAKLSQNPSQKEIDACLENEADVILSKIPDNAYVFALCIEGKGVTSEKFAEMIERSAVDGKSNLVFIIGSSFGLSDRVKKRADYRLSLSNMTFPHQLFRVMLAEQIYRGFAIINGSKYHK